MIEYKKINLKFKQKVIFNNFSLKINKGEKIVFLGKSGSGKSSLFGLTLGFIKPQKGEILFKGKSVNEKNICSLRQQIAFVDQDVSLGDHSVSSWFAFVAGLKVNQKIKFDHQKIAKLTNYFELDKDFLEKDVAQLSGGERQRLAIITAVLLERKIFFLDEVTSALDKKLKQKTADYFIENKEWTVVSISHDNVWLKNPAVKVFDLERGQWKQ